MAEFIDATKYSSPRSFIVDRITQPGMKNPYFLIQDTAGNSYVLRKTDLIKVGDLVTVRKEHVDNLVGSWVLVEDK